MEEKNFALGVVSAVAVIFIWSGFIVFSRMGVATALTPFDISALRFIVAGAITAPFLLRWWPRHLKPWVIVLLIACGPGSIYALMMYFGLEAAPAAYAGVFANGALPIFTMLIAAWVAREVPGPRRALAVAVIVAGGVMVAWRGLGAIGPDVLEGMILFVAASAILSIYIYGLSHWKVTPYQALAIVNVPNMALFLPIWWFFLPSGLAEAETFDIVFQALFQGLGPGFLALILFTLAAMHLGAT
ncbi:MAG: DMT family transporter, partial [Pseudomonadota bacterium]